MFDFYDILNSQQTFMAKFLYLAPIYYIFFVENHACEGKSGSSAGPWSTILAFFRDFSILFPVSVIFPF